MARRSRRTEETRSWVRALVRSGLDSPVELTERVTEALRADHRDVDADTWASRWIAEEVSAWRADAADWPPTTDHDRLQRAFADLERRGFVVLQGCPDHWAARDVARSRAPVGVAWFTETDIWHAVDEGMLEVNLWHASTANAAPGDRLLEDALGAFAAAGLAAHFDEGRIEVAAYWQRRPSA
ncbi:DUF6891 domain-containing protein [Marmoricola sp. RAF53]|uniref:DUF6891 domain-containing protein n=1 Tax=Marmoricola sp. RAF53 TaxID=3233059 RepID=UPI003F9BA111